jgi:intracellular sulfur oxidation DsrE/DsrF family protein
MTRSPLLLSLALSTAVLLGTGCATATAPASAARPSMVIQVSDADPAKWNLALNNARNAQTDLGRDKVGIEIVAYGPGIGMLRDDAVVANRVSEAVKSGISVVACENTMTAQKLDKTAMNPNVSYVPAGVVQLMNRQHQGWAYIRP